MTQLRPWICMFISLYLFELSHKLLHNLDNLGNANVFMIYVSLNCYTGFGLLTSSSSMMSPAILVRRKNLILLIITGGHDNPWRMNLNINRGRSDARPSLPGDWEQWRCPLDPTHGPQDRLWAWQPGNQPVWKNTVWKNTMVTIKLQ